ncbi:monoterpene synthase-like isoform X1 [Eucalyptus grandis]|uniref:monoterpene synthase-like isoform X1 n=1 Tax=Eucalyptus grandis TaxID=71139 RepID=UPI00192EE98C|nr:monoterpene synthase-like isoform X1 [Eucalyptus grandis]
MLNAKNTRSMAIRAPSTSCLPSPLHRGRRPSVLLFKFPRPTPSYSIADVATTAGIRRISCVDPNTNEQSPVARRSANYMPSVWDYDILKSLSVDFAEERCTEPVQRMKEEVKDTLERENHLLAKLELIDAIQRLGLQYHFENDIKRALQVIHDDSNDACFSNDLHSTALRFRLLRQHGYDLSQDAFQRFINKTGTFEESLKKDVKGLLGLYEASFHGLEGENILDEAQDFASKHLKNLNLNEIPTCLAKQVLHALDMPIRWRPNRLEARWFMDMYGKQQDMIPSLLRLAKLDFNLVQTIHRKEVSNLARWWVELGANNMTFSRDRLVENYFWSCLMVFEPQYTAYREMTTKIGCMVTLIDDVYDVYGTLEELVLLTDFIVRWDITNIDNLPPTIRNSFMALYNTTNEIGHWTMREQGINPIPYMRKAWADECRAYIKEVHWYNEGIKPTLKEYMSNAVDSIGGLIMLLHSYFLTTDNLTKEGLDYMSKIPRIMHCSAKILRLNDDLGTSSYELARGDNFKALECYMNETGASTEAAQQHIKHLVRETWKTMNKDVFEDYPFPGFKPFLGACLNLARASQCFYQYGDGHGLPGHETRDHIVSTLFKPVPLD